MSVVWKRALRESTWLALCSKTNPRVDDDSDDDSSDDDSDSSP